MLNPNNDKSFENRILRALRRVIRAVDIYSRKLNSDLGITTPQLVCLCALSESNGITLTALAGTVDLGVSTVNGIVDRLEAKGYLKRSRSVQDRRKTYLELTPGGREILSRAPSLLQDKLSCALSRLSEEERMTIAGSLERIVDFMEAEDVEASPNLFPGAHIAARDSNEKDVLC